jgi:MoxR-like ATPase
MSDNPKGPCKGICVQYKATKPKGGLGRYASGQVRCQVCDIFMTRNGCHDKDGNPADENTSGLWCNCCNYRVTSRPHSKLYNEKLKTYKEIKSLAEQNLESEDDITSGFESEENEEESSIIEDESLPFPSTEVLNNAKTQIREKILIDDSTIEQIVSTLISGKNILLVGAVGSGKTHLAIILPKLVWKEVGGYYPDVYTATSDWTTQNVIGGIYPKLDGKNNVVFDVQNGCVTETVLKNWSKEGERISFDDGENQYRGVWLVIDEFNRANIDKAFGQLFTALEYKRLQIPTTDQNKPHEEIIIPDDYRIIGTLNTADKHFLHSLSDALKRRFAIIEIPIPTYEQKSSELYFVVKKALEDLKGINTTLQTDDAKMEIVNGSDPEAERILETLYTLMLYTREIKPLGTALLISMFRFMIVNHTITNDWVKSLDLALTSIIAPQLESLPYWTLKVARAVYCSDPGVFFKNDPEIVQGNENYRVDFDNFIKFLRKLKPLPDAIPRRFKNSTLTEDDVKLLTPWSQENPRPVLQNFRKAITSYIEEKNMAEELEIE